MAQFALEQFSSGNSGALKNLRVLDLSRLVAGNALSMALADLGADVIKVEPPKGDSLREWRVSGISTAWKAYSRNKRSLCLNFRRPESIEIVLKLAERSDVFVEASARAHSRAWASVRMCCLRLIRGW